MGFFACHCAGVTSEFPLFGKIFHSIRKGFPLISLFFYITKPVLLTDVYMSPTQNRMVNNGGHIGVFFLSKIHFNIYKILFYHF